MHLLDKMEHDYQRKRLEANNPYAIRRAEGVSVVEADLKNQKNKIRNLKKKSLWFRSLEEVMGNLVDIVRRLILAIHDLFDSSGMYNLGSKLHSPDVTLHLYYDHDS